MLQKSAKCKQTLISRCMEHMIAHQLLEQVIGDNMSRCGLETINDLKVTLTLRGFLS